MNYPFSFCCFFTYQSEPFIINTCNGIGFLQKDRLLIIHRIFYRVRFGPVFLSSSCMYSSILRRDGTHFDDLIDEVTLNSNYTDSSTQDFLLQNTSVPTSPPLHYQVIASPPGQPGTMQHLNPVVAQTYAGINTTDIRMVMMPGLQTPVTCVPWPIRIKLLPFDLSRQAAGHYSGTLSVTFIQSLD